MERTAQNRSKKCGVGYCMVVAEPKTYVWKVIALGSGALAGLVSQRVVGGAWKVVRSETPMPQPADRRASWFDALSWAIATGIGAGVARLVALRTAARVWEATIHETPPDPGLQA
jgi:hypothetical protein